KKYDLNEITVIIDYNGLQISGKITDVMPQNIKGNYISDGWKVLEIDGHDHNQIYEALKQSVNTKDTPVAIFAYTKMGKGVSFMEDDEQFHGKALSIEQYKKAITELNIDDDLDKYYKLRQQITPIKGKVDISLKERDKKIEKELKRTYKININFGTPQTYYKDDELDNRTAFGNVLKNFAELNCKKSLIYENSSNFNKSPISPIAVFDCDLATSVKTDKFASICPNNFFEGGIQEHNTATIAGALSTQNILTFFADFGVFGIDETYNQHRLNDINQTNLKLITTHCGLNIGEDGKTHQCIDYLGVMRNLYNFSIIIPADPNQTDRVIRYISKTPGNFLVAMGRSKVPVILKDDKSPFFADDYKFEYGKADLIRDGDRATIISMGFMLHRAIRAWEILKNKGYLVRVLNVSCPTNIDEKIIDECINMGPIVTYEDHNIQTGLGNIIADYIAQSGKRIRFKKMGIGSYGLSGDPEDLFEIQGLSIENLVNSVIKEI
ncbi:MAG: transketolase, partial [Actinobacteria bacterium]|nr:transketolase [Actinomycetota bacterium]